MFNQNHMCLEGNLLLGFLVKKHVVIVITTCYGEKSLFMKLNGGKKLIIIYVIKCILLGLVYFKI